MTKQLSIRDEDHALAIDIADRLGVTPDEIIAQALRQFGRQASPPVRLDADQQAELDAIRALVRAAREHIVPGAFNDHGHLYDWNGLPA